MPTLNKELSGQNDQWYQRILEKPSSRDSVQGWLVSDHPLSAYPVGPYCPLAPLPVYVLSVSTFSCHYPSLFKIASSPIWITYCSSFFNGLFEQVHPSNEHEASLVKIYQCLPSPSVPPWYDVRTLEHAHSCQPHSSLLPLPHTPSFCLAKLNTIAQSGHLLPHLQAHILFLLSTFSQYMLG